ncbi:MAG: hypothetical protein ACLRPZ_13015 [Coprococcus sp.]|jgi:hypothetical protein
MKICCHDRRQDGKQGGKSSAPAKAVAFFSEKQGGKSSAPAKAVAFSFGKQGGLV